MSASFRALREAAGLTQGELASIAGVSRQLVGSLETGRHLPRVDTALALARALGVTAETLFGRKDLVGDVLTGEIPVGDSPVRIGWVGDRMVTAPARVGSDGWAAADGIAEDGRIVSMSHLGPGMVVAGCEPGLETLEAILRQGGVGAIAVAGSSAGALHALRQGRAHGAVVHGPVDEFEAPGPDLRVQRSRLTGWQVGLALPDGIGAGWWDAVKAGELAVVQREEGAAAQRTFTRAVGTAVGGPLVGGHLAAARHALAAGLPGVTIEPAARAVGAAFHSLGWHRAELWVAEEWVADHGVEAALTVISSSRFRRHLEAVGGYELADIGRRVA
jgi:putative molybdopterin biosynthesis protein